MEPTSLIDDAEFSLPLEFLTDDDFLLEKENNVFKRHDTNKCLLPYEPSHRFDSTVKPISDDEKLLAGKMVQSSLEDDFSSGYCVNDAKAWGATRSPLCGADGRRNLNCHTRVSSQAAAWDLYCAAVDDLAVMNINGYNNHSGGDLLDLTRKHPLAAAKISNDGSGYHSSQNLQYQKLQAIQQLKQQQLMQQSRGLGVNPVDLSLSAWSNQQQRLDGSGMPAGKLGSIGTGVFLPRPVTVETRKKTNASWKQRSNNGGFSSQMKMEQPVNEPRLPLEWAY